MSRCERVQYRADLPENSGFPGVFVFQDLRSMSYTEADRGTVCSDSEREPEERTSC